MQWLPFMSSTPQSGPSVVVFVFVFCFVMFFVVLGGGWGLEVVDTFFRVVLLL